MTEQLPPPGPAGVQPAPGEGFVHVDIEVRPSWGYQTAGLSGRLVFPSPRAIAEATPAIDEAFTALKTLTTGYVDELVELRTEKEAAAKGQQVARQKAAVQAPPQPPPPTDADDPGQQIASQLPGSTPVAQAPASDNGWRIGQKPKGSGTVKYLPTSVVPTDAFVNQAKDALRAEGIDPAQVFVFDDRTGKYGLEGGNESYAAGKAKAANDTALKQALGDRDTVAYVDFEDDGTISVHVTKEAKQALSILSNMAGASTPV